MLEKILKSSYEYRNFIESYISQINYFNEEVKYFEKGENETPLKNTNLWIEAHIKLFPELQVFRNFVLDKLKELEIEPYPKYIYENENHYELTKKQITALSDLS